MGKIETRFIKGTDDSGDVGDVPFGITWVDALGTVGEVNVGTHLETSFFKNRAHDFFANPGIDGGF